MQRAVLAELVRAPAAMPVRAPARVTLVHVLLAGDAFEEWILNHCKYKYIKHILIFYI